MSHFRTHPTMTAGFPTYDGVDASARQQRYAYLRCSHYEIPDEADIIATEHVAWAAKAGMSPREVLRSVGYKPEIGYKPGWDEVKFKLRLRYTSHVQPRLDANNRKEEKAA